MNANSFVENGEKSSMLSLYLLGKKHGVVDTKFNHSFNIKFDNFLFHVGNMKNTLSCTGIVLNDNLLNNFMNCVQVTNPVLFNNNYIYIYTTHEIAIINLKALKTIDLKIPVINVDQSLLKQILISLKSINFSTQWGLSDKVTPNEVVRILVNSEKTIEINKTIKFLYGKGKGLTPSGDDILVGFLTLLSGFRSQKKDVWREQIFAVEKKRNTTDVSNSYIHAALKGYTSEKMIRLIDVINNHEENKIAPTLLNIQKTGHTSGTDTLLGIYAAFIKFANKTIY